MFEEGVIDLARVECGEVLNNVATTIQISYSENTAGGAFAPQQAPTHQFVVTLGGAQQFRGAAGACHPPR